jgi:3'-phosphoadenosine 5'-phosphosulfate sulfotransferase (PAPS reductase)/FAD synthetase
MIKVLSFGGGVQSTALLLLHIQGVVRFDAFVFANVGDDSENPDTIQYMDDYIYPLIHKHKVPFHIVTKTRYGKPDTVYQSAVRDNRSIPLPVRLSSGAFGNRTCTADFKIKPVDDFIRREYAGMDVDISIGFSTDEGRRISKKPLGFKSGHGKRKYGFNKRFVFPLAELKLSRHDCHKIIKDAGLPTAPSSACWFCPFKSRAKWLELKKSRPALFEKAIDMENRINEKREHLGRDRVSLHKDGQSLDKLPTQISMFDLLADDLDCGSGYCGL